MEAHRGPESFLIKVRPHSSLIVELRLTDNSIQQLLRLVVVQSLREPPRIFSFHGCLLLEHVSVSGQLVFCQLEDVLQLLRVVNAMELNVFSLITNILDVLPHRIAFNVRSEDPHTVDAVWSVPEGRGRSHVPVAHIHSKQFRCVESGFRWPYIDGAAVDL